jgi:hypothetical protein
MTSGPGITGKTDSPDDAIEEISGLLEMDELKASEAAGSSAESHAVSEEVGDALDVSMETPSPAKLDAYLPPPPVSEEPEPAKQESAEGEAGLGSNMAYEDLLEKLVLPAQPEPVEEPAAHQPTPRPTPRPRPSATHATSPPESLFPSNATPGPITSDERTVVTVNPLLAEEQEAAARGAESYILPAAPPPQPLLPDTPVVVPQVRPAMTPNAGVPSGRFFRTSYPVLGGIVLGGIILGVLVGRAWGPTKVIEKVTVVQAPPVAAPAAPVQAAQPATPTPPAEVVPLPTEAAKPAAQPAAAAAEPAQPASAEAAEPSADEGKPEPKPKAHHAAKARPAKPAAKPAAAAKPVAAAKPAGGKKPGKGWVDPFAN